MNSRWLYRAAGTVGLASGILLVGAAGAQAEEAPGASGPVQGDALAAKNLVGQALTPAAGLPSLATALPMDAVGLPSQSTPAGEQLTEGDPVSDLLGGLTGGGLTGGGDPVSGVLGGLTSGVPAGALPATTLPASTLPATTLPASTLPAQQTLPVEAVDPLGLPVAGTGEQLPALIAEQLAAETGLAGGLLPSGLLQGGLPAGLPIA